MSTPTITPSTPNGEYLLRPPTSQTPPSTWQLIDPDGQPVAEVNRFLHAVGRRGLQPNTLRAYAYDLLCAWRWMRHAGRCLSALSLDSLLDFIEYQRQPPPAAPATINRRLDVLQRLIVFVTGRPPSGAPWIGAAPGLTHRGRRASGVRMRTPHPLVVPP